MCKMKWKLALAGVVLACGAGGFGLGLAWATPSQGLTTTIISGPVELDQTRVVSETEDHGVLFMTRGLSDVYVVYNKIVPGGHTGWHSHPGPSIISVVSGQATQYTEDDLDGTVYAAGTAFVDEGTDAHIIVNEGNTDLILAAFQILPKGAPRRIDQPAP